MYNDLLFVPMESETEKERIKQQEITLLQLKQAIKKEIGNLQVFDAFFIVIY